MDWRNTLQTREAPVTLRGRSARDRQVSPCADCDARKSNLCGAFMVHRGDADWGDVRLTYGASRARHCVARQRRRTQNAAGDPFGRRRHVGEAQHSDELEAEDLV